MQTLPFVHPLSHAPLVREGNGYRCPGTNEFFPDQHGVPSFVAADLASHMDEERTGLINTVKTLLRKYPKFYVFLIFMISPVCFTGISAKRFLNRYKKDALRSEEHRVGKECRL